jgi:addiction module HigA family antidote
MINGEFASVGVKDMPKASKSSTIIDRDPTLRRLPPLHPGEVLREEFLVPLGMSAYAVARACGIPRTRIERLAREETPVTADTALRLGRLFQMTPEFWMGLQSQYDLRCAERGLTKELRKIEPVAKKAA